MTTPNQQDSGGDWCMPGETKVLLQKQRKQNCPGQLEQENCWGTSAPSSCMLLSPPAFIAWSSVIPIKFFLITSHLSHVTSHSPSSHFLTWACFGHSHYKNIPLKASLSHHYHFIFSVCFEALRTKHLLVLLGGFSPCVIPSFCNWSCFYQNI